MCLIKKLPLVSLKPFIISSLVILPLVSLVISPLSVTSLVISSLVYLKISPPVNFFGDITPRFFDVTYRYKLFGGITPRFFTDIFSRYNLFGDIISCYLFGSPLIISYQTFQVVILYEWKD